MNINIKRMVDYDVKCYEGVKIKVRCMYTSEIEKSYRTIKTDKDPVKIEWDMDFIFKTMILEISNLTLTDENNVVTEIKTAEDILYNPGLEELYLELTPLLLSMTARVDAKN